jgi:uncharacterized protein (DUF488 family)
MMTIWTVGHSTRAFQDFLSLLEAHGIEFLADIRTVPRSRRNPQFNREELANTLGAAAIEYRHMPGLGGLRHPRKDSINTAWQNDSFRGYADYMQTEDFARNLGALMELGKCRRIAIMCAEAVPWRCHRSLVADALAANGVEVLHILSETSAKPHTTTGFARIEGGRVTYPGFPVPVVR